MSSLTPGRRWQPSGFLFQVEPLANCLMEAARVVKGALFGCRMCGNCRLRETV